MSRTYLMRCDAGDICATGARIALSSIPARRCRKARFLGSLEAMPIFLVMATPRCVADHACPSSSHVLRH